MRQKWIFGMWQTKFKINDVQCLCVISYQMKYLIWYNNYSPQVHPYLSFVSTAMLLLPLFKYARLNRCIYVTIKCNYRINLSDPKKCDQQIKVQGKWSHVINIAYWNRKFFDFISPIAIYKIVLVKYAIYINLSLRSQFYMTYTYFHVNSMSNLLPWKLLIW